jgi:topoisomerase-4 subunit A
LYRLTNTDIVTLQEEEHQLDQIIAKLQGILNSGKKLIAVIKKELAEVRKKYADSRRTTIEAEIEEIKIDLEVMVASEEVMVSLTKHGYIKRSSLRSYSASGDDAVAMKDTDHAFFQKQMNTTDTLLVFTDKGRYIYLPVHEILDRRWKELGQHIASLVPIDSDEGIISAVPVKDFDHTNLYMTFFTRLGMVKRTKLSEYKAQRRSKPLTALKLKKDDSCLAAIATNGSSDLVLATHMGYGLRFSEEEAGEVGMRAAGVKAVQLKNGDTLAGAVAYVNSSKHHLLIVTDRGAVKKMAVDSQIDKTGRPRRGVQIVRELKARPHHIVGFTLVDQNDRITISTDKGKLVVVQASDVRASDRYNNGSFVLDQDDDGTVTDIWLDVKQENEHA